MKNNIYTHINIYYFFLVNIPLFFLEMNNVQFIIHR